MLDFSNKVIYQIYPKSFRDSDGDGFGDIPGVIEKLDYLKDLGVDYLWLTPFFVSPQRDNGYDVADYRNINPQFGTMEDLENLVSQSNKRGMGIMLDMVFNHTSTQHAWFQKALAGDEDYQKYYIFKEGTPDHAPTNWQSKFGGSAWEYVPQLKKWYLRLFDVTQADLNWDNPKVREELKEILRFWKAKGIQGFRFDVVNLISKPAQMEDDFEGDGRRFYSDGPHVHEYLKELTEDAGIREFVTVGEMSSTSLEHCIRYSAPQEQELSMCFHFHHLKADYKDGDKWALQKTDYKKLKDLFAEWQTGMQKGGGWSALFWCNHDQPRIVSRMGDENEYWKESAKMLAGMIHFMRGTPYIYQGEEIGMLNAHYASIDEYRDVESLNYYKILLEKGKTPEEALEILAARSRDNGRTPMQWNGDTYGGFSDAEPWIPMSACFRKEITAEAQQKDQDSVFTFYKTLISMRKMYPVIAKGEISFLETGQDLVLAYERTLGEQKIIVFCNLDHKVHTIQVSREWSGCQVLLDNYAGRKSRVEMILLSSKGDAGDDSGRECNLQDGMKYKSACKENTQDTCTLEMEPYEFLVLGSV